MTLSYLFLYLIIIVSTLIVYYIRKKLNYWQDRSIPSDTPHILLGSFQGFPEKLTLHDVFINYYNKYKGTGPYCGMYFFPKPVICVLEPSLVKRILIKDFSNFTDRDLYSNEDSEPLSGHLFVMHGSKWKYLRQKITPVFTTGRMRFMFPSVAKVAEEFVEVTEHLLQQQHSVLELRDLCARFITDVIGTCAFGIECHSLKQPQAGFCKIGQNFNKKPDNFLHLIMNNFPELARKLKLRQVPEDINQFFMQAVRETVSFREQHNVRRNDFMDVLIDLKNENVANGQNPITTFTIEKIAAQVFVFFIAGFETSSATISFALYELALNQQVQQEAREEISKTLAKHNNEFTYECMKELQYVQQIIKETLRMYTPISVLMRQAANDYVIPDYPRYKIEKGMSVMIPICAIHRDPEYYPEPHVFKPERFSAASTAERDSCLWLPFGDGPRNCLGMRFGQMQTCIGLALLIKNFKFSVCEQTSIPLEYDPKCFILAAKNGVQLHVEKLSIK